MSYDLLVDKGADGSALGTIEEIRSAIDAAVPGVTWVARGRGVLDDGHATGEFNIAGENPTSFGIVLRGDFVGLFERIENLAATNGWTVFDPQEGQQW
jgi:hypothetical protein